MCIYMENEVTVLSCLVSVYTADTTPLCVTLDPKTGDMSRPSVIPSCSFTHVPACLHVCPPHDHGALTSEATALSTMLFQHPLSRSVKKPSKVTLVRHLSPAGHTDWKAGRLAWPLHHGAWIEFRLLMSLQWWIISEFAIFLPSRFNCFSPLRFTKSLTNKCLPATSCRHRGISRIENCISWTSV